MRSLLTPTSARTAITPRTAMTGRRKRDGAWRPPRTARRAHERKDEGMTEIADVHDQESLDRYWAERGGPPLTVKQQAELTSAERAVANAAVDWYNNLAKPSPAMVDAIEHLIRLRAAR